MSTSDDLAKARIFETRDRLNPFEAIECERTAHIVIDMQNGFVQPQGGFLSGAGGSLGHGVDLVRPINALSRAVRAKGGIVVYIQHVINEIEVDRWKNHYDFFSTPDRTSRLMQTFSPGHRQFELCDGLEIENSDLLITKSKFSAFLSRSSEP